MHHNYCITLTLLICIILQLTYVNSLCQKNTFLNKFISSSPSPFAIEPVSGCYSKARSCLAITKDLQWTAIPWIIYSLQFAVYSVLSREGLWLQEEAALQTHSFRDAEPKPVIRPNAKKIMEYVPSSWDKVYISSQPPQIPVYLAPALALAVSRPITLLIQFFLVFSGLPNFF